jgi:pantetheine-phosphate adenylyltransferase
VFAGSFDPPTLGHLDLVRRGLALVDEVVVGVGHNPGKKRALSLEIRLQLLRDALAGLPGARVEAFEGLTVAFAQRVGAIALLRGVRDANDLAYETPLARANHQMTGVETVFLLADPRFAHVSSSLMKEIHGAGGDISPWVSPAAIQALDQSRR